MTKAEYDRWTISYKHYRGIVIRLAREITEMPCDRKRRQRKNPGKGKKK